MALPLFDYIKVVFTRNEKEWKDLKDIEKSRNFFMLNRFMSINYPAVANMLIHYKIDAVAVSDYWHRSMAKFFNGSTPKWVYAKTVKKKEVEKKLDLPSNEMIKWWLEKNEMSRKEFNQHVKFFGEPFLNEIKALEKILKSQGLLVV